MGEEPLVFSFPINPVNTTIEEAIKAAILKNQRDFYPYFRRAIDKGDDARISLDVGTMEVQNIEMSADEGSASLTMLWSYYAGCRDANSTDFVEADFEFSLEGNEVTFEMKLPILWQREPDED